MGHRNKVTHSEEWWEMLAPPTVVRCEGHYKTGERCRREAVAGANVCRQHGGAAPHVQAVAAARIGNAADEMVKRLHAWLDNPNVDMRDKVKIAQDMLDRAGLNATGKLLVGVGEIDPIERLFRDLLSDPSGLAPAQPISQEPSPQMLAWNREAMEDADIVEGEIVEEVSDRRTPAEANPRAAKEPTPPHIRKALKELGL